MAEDDCEIEYLEEDEELVQQYVQSVPVVDDIAPAPVPQTYKKKQAVKATVSTASESSDSDSDVSDLLVERKGNDQKRKKVSSDSDYDPYEDLYGKKRDPSQKRKRPPPPPKRTPTIVTNVLKNTITLIPQIEEEKKLPKKVAKPLKAPEEELEERKKLYIRIPDFEDPLCLPARALRKDATDVKLLRRWNNLCLEYLEANDLALKPGNGTVVSSCRTIVFKNTNNPSTGRVDTSIWGKLSLSNEKNVKKSEVFQGTLPRYKDSNIKKPYNLSKAAVKKFHHTNEVIMTKEEYKDEEMLVVYQPSESLSAIYKKIQDTSKSADSEEKEKGQMIIREVGCCKVCASCYHASWRGTKSGNQENINIKCALCHCTFVSVYNLLSHIKLHHKAEDVRKCRSTVSKLLAKMIDYHYKCRLCQEQFIAIKDLRKHVISTHKGTTLFKCEIGDHMTY